MKKKLAWSAGVILVLLVALVLYMLPPTPRPFDATVWRTCTDHSIRYAMHADFLKHHNVIGLTRQQLIDLLGKPDSDSKTELSWDLGQYRGADDSAIDFKLKDEKVVSVDVWGH